MSIEGLINNGGSVLTWLAYCYIEALLDHIMLFLLEFNKRLLVLTK